MYMTSQLLRNQNIGLKLDIPTNPNQPQLNLSGKIAYRLLFIISFKKNTVSLPAWLLSYIYKETLSSQYLFIQGKVTLVFLYRKEK